VARSIEVQLISGSLVELVGVDADAGIDDASSRSARGAACYGVCTARPEAVARAQLAFAMGSASRRCPIMAWPSIRRSSAC
jgi:hypothetical protein